MSRLADYFAVVGYDHDKEQTGLQGGSGKILQRFPEKDWEEVPFISGIELFCQPGGWKLVSKPHPPTFYVSVLTDIDALRHYCAVLTFFEATNMTPTKPDDLEGDEEETLVHHTLMFAPKSLVLISRLDYFDTLRNCLGLIYTVYIDSIDVPIETVVGNILGHIQVPPPGGPQVRFSIGANDRQALQPPLTDTLPFSRNAVAMLTQQIGIHNTISLFSAALTDCKILFHSSSYSRLTDACHALQTLLFPVKYCYVYIPVLPAPLTEVLSTPTPFIMGIHSSLKQDVAELLDVIIADLDGGYIQIPECVNLLLPPDHMYDRIQEELTTVLRPDLRAADLAFPKLDDTQVKAEMLDKQIRAIFMRLQSELLMGYRICLTLIRIHPKPVIAFNKGKFLFHRSQVGDDFMSKVLDGMGFNTFVNERGPPYRVCDIFDRTIANIQNTLLEEEGHHSQERALKNIQEIAEHIFLNENPSKQQYLEKVPPPTDGAHTRIYQIPFPKLDGVKVQEVIEDGLAKALLQSINPKANKIRSPKAQIVPCGPQPTSFEEEMNRVNNSARRLEVLRNCISFIFENKIHDARKLFPAVLRSLKSRIARSALAQELGMHVQQNRAMLEQQQFDMVVRLINCALQEDSSSEEFSLTIEILPLALAFCRKLCTGVIQFAYSCVQDHPVWASLHFWETSFYIDVEENIKGLYVPSNTDSDYKAEVINDALVGNPDSTGMTNGYIQIGERSALDIAAEQMRIWPQLKPEMQEELINNEESIVYSQAIHYANRMVCMRVPLDISKGLKNSISIEGDSGGSSNVTGSSVGGSDSYDGEITFEEPGHHDVANSVSKFISRFVDKVCTEAGVSQDHIKQLHSMIRNMVDMHIEMLDAVNKESKRLPPIKKPAILKPTLLPGEVKVGDGLRAYLLPDGREEGQGSSSGGLSFLPAEGAIFLTNYRIIFKGIPIDIQACEQVVTRSFPISSLYKEKKINVGQLSNTLHLEQFMSEGLQLRSTTFQLIRVAFDEEVGMEKVEVFRKNCSRYRFPQNIYQTYAFQGAVISPALTTQMKHKEKSATLRYMKFATKSFLRSSNKKSTLSRGGRPQSAKTMRKEKYLLPHEPLTMQRPPASTSTLPRNLMSGSLESVQTEANNSRPNSMLYDDDDLSNIDLACSTLRPQKGRTMSDASVIDETDVTNTLKPIDVLTADKLMDKKFVHDYERLGFGNPGAQLPSRPKQGEAFRISEVNIHFELSRSYPPLIVVPSALSDDSIRRLAKCHRQLRFPAIVWRHPRTKALLLRSSGFHGKGVMGMIKSSTSQNPRDSTESSTGSKSIEQDKFFSAIVFNTPYGSYHKSDSLVSLNAILPPSIGMDGPDTPTISPRKMHGGSSTLIHRGFLRSSGGKPSGSTMKPATGQSYKFLSLRRALRDSLIRDSLIRDSICSVSSYESARSNFDESSDSLLEYSECEIQDFDKNTMFPTNPNTVVSEKHRGTELSRKVLDKSKPLILIQNECPEEEALSEQSKALDDSVESSKRENSVPEDHVNGTHCKRLAKYGNLEDLPECAENEESLNILEIDGANRKRSQVVEVSNGANEKHPEVSDEECLEVPKINGGNEKNSEVSEIDGANEKRLEMSEVDAANKKRSEVLGIDGANETHLQVSEMDSSNNEHLEVSETAGFNEEHLVVPEIVASNEELLDISEINVSRESIEEGTLCSDSSSDTTTVDTAMNGTEMLSVRSANSESIPGFQYSDDSSDSSRGSSMKMGTLRGFGFGGGSPSLSHKTFTLGSQAVNRNGSITEMDLASSSPRNHDPRKAALYIFGEKSQSRVMKLEQYNKCDFIPYDYVETRHIKTSYKKLMKACLPSNTTADPEMGFRKMVEESEWLVQVQSIMQLAGAVVDLMDLQGSSVMISFEDGWDFTTQVSSLAQLLMDPHYRTIEGFRVLIEKEWLAFGHRFTHRSNQTVAHQTSGFAPVFLQFLDCVHQVQLQFPMSFEYNQYFLQMLAYHYVSNRFQTFMLDSEYERFEASTHVFEDHKPHRIDETGDGASSSKKGPIRCLWEYIDDFHKKSPLFYNLYYAPHVQVLRPYSNISSLRIWEYYLKEKFFGGPSFDRELFEKATAEDNEAPLMPNDRRIVDACYDSVREVQPDLQRWQLEEIRQLEDDIGHSPLRWKQRLDRLEQKFMSQRRRGTAAVQEAQSQSMNAHKKTTIDILIRGKSAGDSQPKGFQISHRFEAHSYMTPTECDLCSQLLYGAVKQGCKGMKCTDCGYNAHAKCVPDVPKQCSRRGSAKEPSSGPPRQVSEESSSVVGTPSTPVEPAMPEYSPTIPILVNAGGISEYDQFHANIGETRTHEGYLYKRGARLKGWKQRWFVLDSQKHQLRYYETRNDQHCKGFIDLKEVESVQPVSYPPMAPKNCDKSAFFDLQTTRRAYNFLADTKSAADEWIRLIQDCLS